ncbi:transposase [Rhodopirellula halodulae]|uniref:transposase n=1 Tax=Rhodopirellula halodulae TaxID=2894198 RepID=UPI001E5CCC6A|nr:transposase [Rhodopirellula sp. JC737]MCC9655596.1 transposase [Rhodopirellula sp. JC737]
MNELHYFDREQDYEVVNRKLPHWSQPGTVCLITFRTADSMPRHVIERWQTERLAWLEDHGIDSLIVDWRQRLRDLPTSEQQDFYRTFSTRWHSELDQSHGRCELRNPAHAKIVGDSLLHRNGDDYYLSDFVVMPNHVHLLAAFATGTGMLKQCESWKRWTARKINESLGRRGRFWQQDGFDHLVRSEEQFQHFRRYIAMNPTNAGLKEGEFLHWSSQA